MRGPFVFALPLPSGSGARRSGLLVSAIVVCLSIASCGTPTEPTSPDDTLTGSWHGTAARGPCGEGWGEDWSSVNLTLVQTGPAVTGEIYAPQGRRFPVTSTDGVTLGVGGLEGTSTCYAFGLTITNRDFDAQGNLRRFSGTIGGRCCGTVAGAFAFDRQ